MPARQTRTMPSLELTVIAIDRHHLAFLNGMDIAARMIEREGAPWVYTPRSVAS